MIIVCFSVFYQEFFAHLSNILKLLKIIDNFVTIFCLYLCDFQCDFGYWGFDYFDLFFRILIWILFYLICIILMIN